ncbi:MAG: lipopolysaccharide biosynthesis protein [Muribaculaceae bacterium]|nr:lipopolysaccharide biosynthesis protein [Muribaculaceae bacterium]
MPDERGSLKQLTARSLKWNVIDRVASQGLYAITGIILARVLSQEDFGLVGAIFIFQAFAQMLVDSGFSTALIQRKSPTSTDYSTVFWFNIGVAMLLYLLLFTTAPLIASIFHDSRITLLSRVMFLAIIINSSSIVQANRLMKQMNVRPLAAANALGLTAGAIAGIYLALMGYGAWAIVWQTIVNGAVKSLTLWLINRWLPALRFSIESLKSFFKVGSGILATSFLNTVFQNIYSFFIGNMAGMAPLGYYTQADKWSKMGITSLSQSVTSAFLPTLAEVQDDATRLRRTVGKMNKFTAYLTFPAMGFLIVMSAPIFHLLFGAKWDPSIILFQLLLMRGVFTVFTGLYNNYLVTLAESGKIVIMEALRDGVAIIALVATLPMIRYSTPENPVAGLTILLVGQLIASALTWLITLIVTARKTGCSTFSFLRDLLPYMVITVAIMVPQHLTTHLIAEPWLLVVAQSAIVALLYLGINKLLRSKIQREVLEYLSPRKDLK